MLLRVKLPCFFPNSKTNKNQRQTNAGVGLVHNVWIQFLAKISRRLAVPFGGSFRAIWFDCGFGQKSRREDDSTPDRATRKQQSEPEASASGDFFIAAHVVVVAAARGVARISIRGSENQSRESH